MTIKMIATDMDGTFLLPPYPENPEIDHFNEPLFVHVMQELQKRDIKMVMASGRQVGNIQSVFEPVLTKYNLSLDFVGSNGAKVSTATQVLQERYLSLEQIAKVIEWNKNHHGQAENLIIMSGDKATYVSNHATPKTVQQVKQFYPHVVQVEKLMAVDDHILEFSFVWPPHEPVGEYVAKLRDIFGEELHATGSGFGSVDILGIGVNKASGLAVLQEHYGISDDEVMVFGDNENDLEMLTAYPNAYVMPNAEAFMQKGFAQAVADNGHDGVLKTIQKVVLNESID